MEAAGSKLASSFVSYLGAIPGRVYSRVMRVVSRFCARLIDSRGVDQALVSFDMAVRKQVRAWRAWALSSDYWGGLWRALIHPEGEEDDVYGLDVALVLSYLTKRDRAMLDVMYFTHETERLDQETFLRVQRHLVGWCWAQYHTKLKFIVRYDPATSPQDVVNDLMLIGVRTIRRYEHLGNENQTINYAKRAISNASVNMIKRATSNKRRRLERVDHDPSREYRCRLRSLEEEITSNGNVDLCECSRLTRLLSTIRIELGDKYADYAQAVLGHNPDFDHWVQTKCRKNPDNLSPKSAAKLARRWTGIDPKDLQHHLAPVLASTMHA